MCYMWALFLWLFFLNQPQKQIFESVCLVLIKTKYDVRHWKLDRQWHKPTPAASAGFFLIVTSRIDWLYFYQQTQEKSRVNVGSKYDEEKPKTTSLPAIFFSRLVFHLHSFEFLPIKHKVLAFFSYCILFSFFVCQVDVFWNFVTDFAGLYIASAYCTRLIWQIRSWQNLVSTRTARFLMRKL